MSHLPESAWHGYATEPRSVVLVIASDLAATQIASAELRIADQESVSLVPEDDPNGYLLTAAHVVLPAPGTYGWSAEVQDADGNAPIVVAIGSLRVDARIPVTAPVVVAV